MVEVAMGIDDGHRLQPVGCYILVKLYNLALLIHTGVHNPATLFSVNNEVSVFLEGIEGESL
jgi:hypothetical protein